MTLLPTGEVLADGEYREIILEKNPPLGRIILNEPEKMNPLNWRRIAEIGKAAKELEWDDDIKVIVLKGAGRCFSSGFDLTPPENMTSEKDYFTRSRNFPPGGRYVSSERDWISGQYNRDHLATFFLLWDLDKPVIAQIHGYCLAGATELASFCDIRMVAEGTQIGYPVARQLTPGNIQWFVWFMGITKATEFMFTGDPMTAEEAHRVGWATRVYPASELEAQTEKFAQRVAQIPTKLIMMTKRSLHAQLDVMGFRTGLQWGSDILSVTNSMGQTEEFFAGVKDKSLKEGLQQRDKAFGDYGTAEGQKK